MKGIDADTVPHAGHLLCKTKAKSNRPSQGLMKGLWVEMISSDVEVSGPFRRKQLRQPALKTITEGCGLAALSAEAKL